MPSPSTRFWSGEVVPLFYDRDADGLPAGMDRHDEELHPRARPPPSPATAWSRQYAERFYVPAGDRYERLAADGFAKAKELTAWRTGSRAAWCDVRVTWVEERGTPDVTVGEEIRWRPRCVWAAWSPPTLWSRLTSAACDLTVPCAAAGLSRSTGRVLRTASTCTSETVPSRNSGLHGYAVRVLPCHEDVLVPNELPLIAWEEAE